MNVIIVDTSVWIDYLNGQDIPDVDLGLKEGRIYSSPIVISELLSGKLKKAERLALIDLLGELPLCNNDFTHWCRVGELRERLKRKGFSVSTPDAHLMQAALDFDCYLMSYDQIFSRVSKLIKLKTL